LATTRIQISIPAELDRIALQKRDAFAKYAGPLEDLHGFGLWKPLRGKRKDDSQAL